MKQVFFQDLDRCFAGRESPARVSENLLSYAENRLREEVVNLADHALFRSCLAGVSKHIRMYSYAATPYRMRHS